MKVTLISFSVKSHNPLVKGFKLTYCYEDFELKKLLFNMLTVLAKDLCIVQVGMGTFIILNYPSLTQRIVHKKVVCYTSM